jgi:cysteine-rich repeat protein
LLYGAYPDATQCQDDSVDLITTYQDEGPVYYNNFVGQMFAHTNRAIRIVPTSVDVIPGGILPSDIEIDGGTVTIDQAYPGGERHLWFDIMATDWDPDMAGTTLKAWQVTLDSSGYTAGRVCTLTPWQPPCTTDADCDAAQGPIGFETFPLRGGCNLPGLPPNVCAAGFTDGDRSDYIFRGENTVVGGVDQSTLDYRYGASKSGTGMVSPHSGDRYMGTLTLRTMCDCPAGDFFVGIGLPNMLTFMYDGDNQFIPMLGVQAADVIFPTGQCCDLTYSTCISDTITRCECERIGIDGGFPVKFDPRMTCADPCFDCLTDEYCIDRDACTMGRCVDAFCEYTPVSVGPTECCNWQTDDDWVDVGGFGAISSNDDGNPCTADMCDAPGTCGVGDQCGVPYNPAHPAGAACYDGEPCLTVDDQCDGAGNCVGTPISSVPCASDADCASITGGLGSCNFVTGFCQCPAPVCGNGIIETGETCDDGNFAGGDGCSAGCAVESSWTCSGEPSVCTRIRVPTVSQWGLIVMGLLLLGGAKVYFSRRRQARA